MAVFLLATAGTGVLISIWRKRSAARLVSAGGPDNLDATDDSLRARIRRETEY
jgi:cytochrome c-type biogenesis protein CcmH